MLGISRRSSKALGFVIDTTKSMSDDIDAVRRAAISITDSEVGTQNEPSFYILVPFNDPGMSFRWLQICENILIKHDLGM